MHEHRALLSASLLLVACGGHAASTTSPPPASPAPAASADNKAAAAKTAASCKTLVDRIEKLDADARTTDTDDPLAMGTMLKKARGLADGAATDLSSLDVADENVRALAHDYGSYAKARAGQIGMMEPFVEKFVAAVKKLKESKTALEETERACPDKTKPACKKQHAEAEKKFLADSGDYAEAQAALKSQVQDDKNAKDDAELAARQDALNGRLESLCGYEAPKKK